MQIIIAACIGLLECLLLPFSCRPRRMLSVECNSLAFVDHGAPSPMRFPAFPVFARYPH